MGIKKKYVKYNNMISIIINIKYYYTKYEVSLKKLFFI